MSAIDEIAAERKRQIEVEGWTADHDDKHIPCALALAAACYAANAFPGESIQAAVREMWPWEWKWWKPKDKRRDLVRAGALIVAEIERYDRAIANRAYRRAQKE